VRVALSENYKFLFMECKIGARAAHFGCGAPAAHTPQRHALYANLMPRQPLFQLNLFNLMIVVENE
jgi:hypothetical protein